MLPRLDLSKLTEYLAVLRLQMNASKEEVREAYKIRVLETHPDKHPDKEEEFKKVSAAFEALSGVDLSKDVLQYDVMASDNNAEDSKTVQEYIKRKTSHIISSDLLHNCHFDPNLKLDEPANFYIYIPYTAGLSGAESSPLEFDPTDYLYVISSACKGRYLNIFSNKDEAIRFNTMGQSSTGYPLTSLQYGYCIDFGGHKSYQVPKLISQFVIYEVSGITPRKLIEGDPVNILPLITGYMTDHLDTVPEEIKRKLLALELAYNKADSIKHGAYSNYYFDNNNSVLSKDELRARYKQASDARHEVHNQIAAYLSSIGTNMTYEEYEQSLKTRKPAVMQPFPEAARLECMQKLMQDKHYWYVENVLRYQERTAVLSIAATGNVSLTKAISFTTFSREPEQPEEKAVELQRNTLR